MDITDIIIKVTADTRQAIGEFKGLTVVLQNIQKQASRSSEEIKRATISNFKGMRAIPKALFSTGAIPNINAELKALGSRTITTGDAQDYLGGAIKRATSKLDLELKNIKKLNKAMEPEPRKFQGWAMSIMFFGMAMQKTFDTIWKSSTKTFQDISHSVEGTTTGFDIMEGSIKYLGFSIGEALEPMISYLVPIVDKVADWVSQHEELTGKIVAGGLALGAIFQGTGGGVLAINGFLELSDKIKKATDGAIGVKQQLTGIVATGYAIDMGVNLVEGDVFGAAASGFESAGLFALIAGKGKAGAILFSIGAAIDIIDAIVDGKGKLSVDTLAGLMMKMAPGLLMMNPAIGAAVLTIGLGLTLLPDQFKSDLVAFLGTMFGIVALLAAGIIDTLFFVLTTPINQVIKTVNKIIDAINYFKDEKDKIDTIGEISQWTLTSMAFDRLNEIASQVSWGDSSNNNNNNNVQPQITNNIEIVVNESSELNGAVDAFQRTINSGWSSISPTGN